jgi:hypothetical protein
VVFYNKNSFKLLVVTTGYIGNGAADFGEKEHYTDFSGVTAKIF